MFRHILLFAIVLVPPLLGNAIILSCTLVPIDYANSTCVNADLQSFSFSTKLTGIDLGENTAARITKLFLTSKFMYYMPNNIFKFFPNVSEIGIHTALPQLIKIEKEIFNGLKRLHKVFIVGQRLRYITADVFKGAPAITDLFLPSNQIQSVHESAFNGLVNCRYLWLGGNLIDTLLPGTFASMPNLWSVNLSKNRLMVIVNSVFANNKVVILDLAYNKIESIPEHMITNFAANKDPKKLLSMKGNICDNRIYTKNTKNVEKNLAKCLKGSDFLSDSELVDQMREAMKILIQNNDRLELENHNLLIANDRLNSELDKVTNSSSCDEKKCHTIFGHVLQSPFNAIQSVIPQMNAWRERSEKLFTILASIHGDGTCVEPFPNVTKPTNDCANQEQLVLISSVEDQVNVLMKTVEYLHVQIVDLNQFVEVLLRPALSCPVISKTNFKVCATTVCPLPPVCDICAECPVPEIVTCPPPEECPTLEPTPVCEVCHDITTMGPVYCPNVICPIIQSPSIRCPPCFSRSTLPMEEETTTTEAVWTNPSEIPCKEYLYEIKNLESELIALRAINRTYHKKTFKRNCSVEMEIEELDKIVLTQSFEIESMKKIVDDFTQGVTMLRREAELVERTSQRRLAENYDLKEGQADCTSLRQIDLIEITSKVSKTLILEKDRTLDKVIARLKRFVDVRDIWKYDEFKDVVEEAVVKDKDVSKSIVLAISTVKKKYQQLKDGDIQIQKFVSEISMLLTTSSRRGMFADKLLEFNNIIMRKVDDLETTITEQYEIMNSQSQKIQELLAASMLQITAAVTKRRAMGDSGKNYPIILQPLTGFNKTLIEKDDLIRNQYDKFEKYLSEIKDSRIDLQKAFEEYQAQKKDIIDAPQMEDLDDAIGYVDDKMRACADRTNEKLEKTVGDQLTRIGVLRDEVDEAGDNIENMKTLFKDLLKQCNHCRSYISKGLGIFEKMFGKTNGCDFKAYENKHFELFK